MTWNEFLVLLAFAFLGYWTLGPLIASYRTTVPRNKAYTVEFVEGTSCVICKQPVDQLNFGSSVPSRLEGIPVVLIYCKEHS